MLPQAVHYGQQLPGGNYLLMVHSAGNEDFITMTSLLRHYVYLNRNTRQRQDNSTSQPFYIQKTKIPDSIPLLFDSQHSMFPYLDPAVEENQKIADIDKRHHEKALLQLTRSGDQSHDRIPTHTTIRT